MCRSWLVLRYYVQLRLFSKIDFEFLWFDRSCSGARVALNVRYRVVLLFGCHVNVVLFLFWIGADVDNLDNFILLKKYKETKVYVRFWMWSKNFENITLIAEYAINFHRTQKCSKNIVLEQKHKKRPTLSRYSLRLKNTTAPKTRKDQKSHVIQHKGNRKTFYIYNSLRR